MRTGTPTTKLRSGLSWAALAIAAACMLAWVPASWDLEGPPPLHAVMPGLYVLLVSTIATLRHLTDRVDRTARMGLPPRDFVFSAAFAAIVSLALVLMD